MTGPTGLRLASYNIRKAVGLDWRRDPGRVLRVIRGLGAQVVALQEADRRLGPRLSALPRRMIEDAGFRPAPVAQTAVSVGWHGNAVLVAPEVQVLGTAHIDLPGIEPRGAVRVDLETRQGPLTVVAVHLGLRRACRRLQCARLLGALEETGLDRAVLMGDFNEWSPTTGLEGLQPYLRVVTPGRSFHARRRLACLDRFALGPGVRLLDAGVEDGPEARVASDHLPVWADVMLAADAGRSDV